MEIPRTHWAERKVSLFSAPRVQETDGVALSVIGLGTPCPGDLPTRELEHLKISIRATVNKSIQALNTHSCSETTIAHWPASHHGSLSHSVPRNLPAAFLAHPADLDDPAAGCLELVAPNVQNAVPRFCRHCDPCDPSQHPLPPLRHLGRHPSSSTEEKDVSF